MFRFLRKPIPDEIEFCDRCGSVCDAACRASAAVEQSRLAALTTYGWRIV